MFRFHQTSRVGLGNRWKAPKIECDTLIWEFFVLALHRFFPTLEIMISQSGVKMERKKLSFADHAWLRMDDPLNPMVITGLMIFDEPLKYEGLKAVIENSMLKIRRFRQRIVPSSLPFMRPAWEDDPTFNLDTHLERITLPPPGDQKALQDFIGELMSTELDYSHPLWHFYLVENYGNGSAFIARLHHGIADGIALMQVLLSLTEQEPGYSKTDQSPNKKQTSTKPIRTNKSATLPTSQVRVRDLVKDGKKMLCSPSHARYRTGQIAKIAAAIGKIVVRWPDPRTVFKGPLGYEKCAAWSEPIDLKDVKFIGKTFSSTVNDVLLTAVAGALGRYMQTRENIVRDLSIHGFIPVNLRPIQLDGELGNKFGLVFLSLPLNIDDPVLRLRKVKHNMDELKSSAEAVATFGVINLLGVVHPRVEEIAINFFDTKGTTVITNVPGPQTQLYLAGAPINTVMAWVPQSGRISLGISIISYNGKVWLGVASDEGLVPDPEKIVSLFYTDYEELKSQAQTYQIERQKNWMPIMSKLSEAIQTLDELLAESS